MFGQIEKQNYILITQKLDLEKKEESLQILVFLEILWGLMNQQILRELNMSLL